MHKDLVQDFVEKLTQFLAVYQPHKQYSNILIRNGTLVVKLYPLHGLLCIRVVLRCNISYYLENNFLQLCLLSADLEYR